jgi:AcrR family transcriptional regulator
VWGRGLDIRVPKMNVVHTLNVVRLTVVPDDRRERTRDKKRQRFLDAASRIIDRDGLGGVTMAAIADELDCAVGTIYGYFPSKAALVAALSQQAIATLRASYQAGRHGCDDFLVSEAVEPELVPLVLLQAYTGFFAAASVVLADEFFLQRALLTEAVGSDPAEEARPSREVLMALLEDPRRLIADAVEAEVLEDGDAVERALRWVGALNGVLVMDGLAPLDRHLFRGAHLARALTADLLVGWGAVRSQVEGAAALVDRLAAMGPLAPPPE